MLTLSSIYKDHQRSYGSAPSLWFLDKVFQFGLNIILHTSHLHCSFSMTQDSGLLFKWSKYKRKWINVTFKFNLWNPTGLSMWILREASFQRGGDGTGWSSFGVFLQPKHSDGLTLGRYCCGVKRSLLGTSSLKEELLMAMVAHWSKRNKVIHLQQ